MFNEFSNTRDVAKTRKTHCCDWCGIALERGSSAVHCTGKCDGTIFSIYYHHECYPMLDTYRPYDEEWDSYEPGQERGLPFEFSKRFFYEIDSRPRALIEILLPLLPKVNKMYYQRALEIIDKYKEEGNYE